MRPGYPISCWTALAMLLLLPSVAQARVDYDPANDDWNGLSQLKSIAARVDVQLSNLKQLDWSKLPPTTVLLWIYPRKAIPRKQAESFLRDGGRLIVADDFGAAKEFLESFGLLRVSPPIHARRTYQGMANLPVLATTRSHFLFSYIRFIVTNHPAAYRSKKPGQWKAHLTFLDAQNLFLAERKIGRGRLLVLSDPSVLINLMLEFDDNFQFAANLLLYLCQKKPCQLRVVLPDAKTSGKYIPQNLSKIQSLNRMLKRGLKLLNERLRRIGDGPRSEMVLLFVSLVCLIGSLVVLTGWVLGRALPRSFNFERAWISPLSEFEHQVELFRKNKLQADFAEPLQRMKHVLIHQLTPLAGDLETQAGRSKLADAVVRKAGGRLGLADVTGILESLTKLERLERELLTYRFVSHEEFDRIFKRCRPLLELFEENDNHTRTR